MVVGGSEGREGYFEELFEHLPDAAFVHRAGRIELANRAMLALVGADGPGQVVGQPAEAFFHPGDAAEIAERRRRLLRGEAVPLSHQRVRSLDGREIVAQVASRLVDPAGPTFQVVLRDVTEPWRREVLLQAITDSTPNSILAKDLEGRLTYANRAAQRAVGRSLEELVGRTDAEVVGGPEVAAPLEANTRRVFSTGETETFEEVIHGPGGPQRFLATKAPLRDVAGRLTGMVVVAKDVTDLRRVEAQLAISRRLAALGTLVAGVAHEVNGPLGVVVASHQCASDDLARLLAALGAGVPPPPEELRRVLVEVQGALRDVRAGTDRMAAVVRDLYRFSSPNAARARVRLGEVVEGARRWLPAAVAERADLRVEDLGAPEVEGAQGQLEQVVVNLVVNAAKATRPGTRGEVTVRVGGGAGGSARLEVADRGVGMDPATLDRIFDPFFTTRAPEEGTGLGLAICHAIVTAHGGTITAASAPGEGTSVVVALPGLAAGAG